MEDGGWRMEDGGADFLSAFFTILYLPSSILVCSAQARMLRSGLPRPPLPRGALRPRKRASQLPHRLRRQWTLVGVLHVRPRVLRVRRPDDRGVHAGDA